MLFKLRATTVVLVIFLATSVLSMGAESVNIISDLGQETTGINVVQNNSSDANVSINVRTASVTPVNLNGKEYKEIKLPEGDHLFASETTEEGKPSIPALTTLLAIADQAGVQLSVSYSGYDIIDNIELAPVQPSPSDSDPAPVPFTKDESFYNTDTFYPGDLAKADDPVIMRDIRMVSITMYPVQYNPLRKQLRIYRDLSVSVTDGGEVINPKTTHNRYLSDGFYPIYKSMIANFDQVFSSEESQRGGYLIITKPVFADSLKNLALWKRKKGYTVKLVQTTEINSNGTPTTSQVRSFIQNAYNTWETPPEYVMIVGDKDQTQSTGIVDAPYTRSPYTYASDNDYACVDGVDYIPDIFVARLSVDNPSQLRIAVSKILTYENHPFMGDPSYWLRGLSIAGNVNASSPRTTVLWVRQLLLQHGFTQVDTSFRYSSMEVDPLLQGYFEQGNSIVSYRGWAGSSGWYAPYYQISDLNRLHNNQKIGVMASLVCGTGDFNDECFGESWIRMGYSPDSLKGGPAFYGVSDHDTHTKWNNPIMVGYYFGIFNEGVYHFAAAAVRGKLQQYRTFPNNRGVGDWIDLYFHTYNMLGDPELEMRTAVPIPIRVTYPDTLGFGINHIEADVVDTLGNPISNAYVTLLKINGNVEEVFKLGKTDESGHVALPFDSPSIGPMYITVSGRNLYPFQGLVQIISDDIAVGFDSLTIDDDNDGFSHGNGDSFANPGETIELGTYLKNFGNTITAVNVNATLESFDNNLAEVLDGNRNYGDIAPGQSVLSTSPFVIHIKNTAGQNDVARVKVNATDANNDSWYSVIEIPINAPKYNVTSIAFPGGNGRLDPGETVQMVLTLTNYGSVNATGVTGTLTTEDDYTTITSANCSFGDIAINGSGSNTATPIELTSESGTFNGRTVNLVLHATSMDGSTSEVPFSITVGAVASTDPIGPDTHGYYMYDNTDAGYAPVPTYQWVEINPNAGGHGSRVVFDGGNYDDNTQIVTLPFDFIYYGVPYRYLAICTNGFVAVDTAEYDMAHHHWNNFFNWPIPDPGNARGQISPFWDDLSFTGSNYGVYTWYDTANANYYVEWYHVNQRNTSAVETFQMIITDAAFHTTITGDAEITYQYNTILNNDVSENYATVGFESWDELTGLQYTDDNIYTPGAPPLAAGLAIKITTNTGRGGIVGSVNLNNGGNNQNVNVRTSDGEHRLTARDGSYWLRNVPPGIVSVTAEANGYLPSTIDSITVAQNVTVKEVNFNLTLCPTPSAVIASEGLGDRIEINWTFSGHSDFAGYNVYRGSWENGQYTKLNSQPISTTSFTDNVVPDSNVYWYYVTATYAGQGWTAESFASNRDSGSLARITGIDDKLAQIPTQFSLSQNYPNPFNPTTTISYGLPKTAKVKIDVFNLMGQKVRTLVNEQQGAGYKTIVWDGNDNSGNSVSSGVYFYRIDAGDYNAVHKMMMLK